MAIKTTLKFVRPSTDVGWNEPLINNETLFAIDKNRILKLENSKVNSIKVNSQQFKFGKKGS